MAGDDLAGSNRYQSPESATVSSDADRSIASRIALSRKRLTLLTMLVPAMAAGISVGLMADPDTERLIGILVSFSLNVQAAIWCNLDSQERGLPRWKYLGAFMVICPGPAVMIPLYFFRTRGVKGVISLLGVVAFLAVLIGVATIAAYVTLWLTHR